MICGRSGLGVVDLADGFAVALTEELDFRVEARNIAAVSGVDTGIEITLPTVHTDLSSERVLVMSRLDGAPVRTAICTVNDERRDGLARALLDCMLRQVLLHGVFHADPHPGNVLLLADGKLGLPDFGSVGRLDAALRGGLRDVLAAVDRGDPAGLRDGLLEIADRPDEIDEQRLERALGALIAKHVSHGQAPDLGMFTDLFRVWRSSGCRSRLRSRQCSVALATVEGTLALLAPGFNILVESRAFANRLVGERLQPDSLRRTATEELMSPLPVLRRLPRRVDRVTSALEQGRLSVNIRLFADERDRAVVTGMLHELLLAFTGMATGVMAVLLLTSIGGPKVSTEVTLNQLLPGADITERVDSRTDSSLMCRGAHFRVLTIASRGLGCVGVDTHRLAVGVFVAG